MKTLGQAGSALPRTRPGDYDRALALVAGLGNDKAVKAKLTELKDAQAAHDTAREKAEGATAETTKRDTTAREAEADAIRARQALADETATARTELGQREKAVAERERLATECEKSQEARDKELLRREEHLKQAGVRGF